MTEVTDTVWFSLSPSLPLAPAIRGEIKEVEDGVYDTTNNLLKVHKYYSAYITCTDTGTLAGGLIGNDLHLSM